MSRVVRFVGSASTSSSKIQGSNHCRALDRRIELGVAAPYQRVQARRVEAARQRPGFGVGDVGQPAAGGDAGRLDQHAAQKTVEHADIERIERFRQPIEQRLQFVEFGVVQRARRCRRAG